MRYRTSCYIQGPALKISPVPGLTNQGIKVIDHLYYVYFKSNYVYEDIDFKVHPVIQLKPSCIPRWNNQTYKAMTIISNTQSN